MNCSKLLEEGGDWREFGSEDSLNNDGASGLVELGRPALSPPDDDREELEDDGVLEAEGEELFEGPDAASSALSPDFALLPGGGEEPTVSGSLRFLPTEELAPQPISPSPSLNRSFTASISCLLGGSSEFPGK